MNKKYSLTTFSIIKDILCIGIIAELAYASTSGVFYIEHAIALLAISTLVLIQFHKIYKASASRAIIKTRTNKAFNVLLLLTCALAILFTYITKNDHSGANFSAIGILFLISILGVIVLTFRIEQIIMYTIDDKEDKSK